ncbi:rhomboid domain-containing protein 2 isoform X1 [Pristis pectinata]|uniref:rhomboid domain-containing protein 2 isoform X1 n=1 Tax=Pristis pectinata TaxID=685728 RepID=UPI00223DB156|nr:rhomboid domain-containing protein 2 isoform X1 [Pristis pectinata]
MAVRREQEQQEESRSEPPSLVQMVKGLIPVLPCATVSAALLGWILFYLTCRYRVLDEQTFTLGNFQSRLQVYKVLSYVFIHKSMSALVCNVLMLWYFGGAMEKDIGTVKFAYLTLLLAILSGIIYVIIGSIFFGLEKLKEIQGFTVVVFAFVGMSVFLSPMKSVVFITTIKVIYLPFVLLVLSIFIPESSILGNVSGIAAGIVYAYGRRYFPYLDMHEMTAASLERYFPFNSLKNLPGIAFYSALWEVRNVETTNRCNPKPGSYPTQTYYFPPSTDPEYCYYSGILKEQINLYGHERQQHLSYNLESFPGFGFDVGRASEHGHSHDIMHPPGHVFNHDLRQTFGHGHSHDVGTSEHGHGHDVGHGHDLGHVSGCGHTHNLARNPEHGCTCDRKPDSQYPEEVQPPGLQQGFKSFGAKQDSFSVVMD